MKLLGVAVLATVVVPGVARAAPLTALASRDVPLHGGAAHTARFDLVGLHWLGAGSVSFRTHAVGGGWSAWHPAAPEPEDRPDGPPGKWKVGNPWWAGASDGLQVRTRGQVGRVRSYLVSSSAPAVPSRQASVAGSPQIITRAAWRADEKIRRANPKYASSIQLAVVHHTAGSNTYTKAQSAAIVRAIEVYHVKGNGWNDIGYNFLVDKYGQVFEGRWGGIARNVVGAHAEGFNTGSVGIALMGNYTSAQPTKAQLDAVARLIAWRLDIAHVDPLGMTTYISNGNARFPSDTPVFLHTVSGHRDTGYTDCPGANVYSKLAALAVQAQAVGLPKIYAPSIRGRVGGPVRFTARLSSSLPWTVSVLDPAGASVGAGSNASSSVDWTWDSTGMPAGRYTYEIDAGEARPVTGVVGATGTTVAPVSLTATPAAAVLSPNGDGRSDSLTVRWTLDGTAQVRAEVLDEFGSPLSTLLDASRAAGTYNLVWRGSALPDGRYTVQLTATGAAGGEVTASVAVLVDRTLSAFAGSSHYLSPNADGKADRVAFTFGLGAPAHVKLRLRQGKTELGTVYEGDLVPGPQRLVWDGTLNGVFVADGQYQAVLSATDDLATVSQGANLAIDTKAPTLTVLSGPNLRFRLDEDAVVRLVIDGRHVVKVEKRGAFHVPNRVLAKKVSAFATDPAGNRGATVGYP